jgi:hypothetical protein
MKKIFLYFILIAIMSCNNNSDVMKDKFSDKEIKKIEYLDSEIDSNRLKKYSNTNYTDDKSTNQNIADLLVDCDQVWSTWINNGVDTTKEFNIDFDFYSSRDKESKEFSDVLEAQGLSVNRKSTRTMLILKGWEIRVTFKDYWTLNKVESKIIEMGVLSNKYNVLIEGFGAFTKNEKK